jgi:hypothetical protein
MSGASASDGCLAVDGSAWRTAGPAPGAQRGGRSGTAWAGYARGGCGCTATPAGARCVLSPERRPPGLGGRVRKAPHAPYPPWLMAYTDRARAQRWCTATTKTGLPCRAYACWDDPAQRCVNHSNRHHTGPLVPGDTPRRRTAYTPCVCAAYGWPHRPGGGQCRWLEPPRDRCTTPTGTHRRPR